ncbi:hypothetical protein Tco_1172164 [Tanacetum coccineum]
MLLIYLKSYLSSIKTSSCGNGARYGYNCSPKVPIISIPEPCNNQTVDELPQTLPSFDPTCYSGDGNTFTYDSTPNFVNDSLISVKMKGYQSQKEQKQAKTDKMKRQVIKRKDIKAGSRPWSRKDKKVKKRTKV